MRIGIFDSGIGGINVLKEIKNKYPNQHYIYYGDTLHLPYGEKTKEDLIALGLHIIRFFEKENVDIIIIACGTCSCLIEEYQKLTSIPIYDIITSTVEYVQKHYSSVALIATKATIENGIFEQKLKEKELEVYCLACPNFVLYLEDFIDVLSIEKELKFLKDKAFETIILGCTHYPLLQSEIESYLKVPSIDMGKILSESLHFESDNSSLTIYMSKVTEKMVQKVSDILKEDIIIEEKVL